MAKSKKAKAAKSSAKKTTKKAAVKRAGKKVTKKAAAKKTPAKKLATKKTTARLAGPVTAKAQAAHGPRVRLGEAVPNFEVPATGGKRISLAGLKGKCVVLYFYPKDATPGCTIEGHEFTKLHGEFQKVGAEVFGISRDDLNSHEKFKSKECFTVDLLSDTEGELCAMFDVIKLKNMYGRQVQGIERSTFVIDREGKLVKEWRGVKAEGHAAEVLAYLQGTGSAQ